MVYCRDKQGESHIYTTNVIYNHMSRVLRAVVTVGRALPAYRLSRKQGRDSFVICYKVGKGEPGARMLGEGALSASAVHVADCQFLILTITFASTVCGTSWSTMPPINAPISKRAGDCVTVR